jgi:alkylated DNA repair dioxygenase AlkB
MHDEIDGLRLIDAWISADEAASLLAAIDAEAWRADLSRRVQHYGWRYDYKARSIDASMRLGPLPSWAEALADRVEREGLSARPEQVIVNEYEPGQGIAAHIDCVPCFGPVVLSLSLGSACVMDLRREGDPPRAITLAPRSLLALSGEARLAWKHGIAARKSDVIDGVRVARGRRISVTFRTVRVEGER